MLDYLKQHYPNVLGSPSSTIKAAISLAIAVLIAVMALPPKASLAVVTLAILRALMGFLQQDVGKQPVVTQTGAVESVDAHQVPDQK